MSDSLHICLHIQVQRQTLYNSENENKLHIVKCHMPKDKILRELKYLEVRELQDISAHMDTLWKVNSEEFTNGTPFPEYHQLWAKLTVQNIKKSSHYLFSKLLKIINAFTLQIKLHCICKVTVQHTSLEHR